MTTILIVDDDADVRALLQMAFRLAPGWTVLVAESVAAARRVLADAVIDVVLTDDRLDDGRGEDVRTAAQPRPVILLSASVKGPPSILQFAPGYAGSIAKPFDPLRLPGLVDLARKRWTEK